MLLTGSVVKPIEFAVSTIPVELSEGIVYSAVGQIGQVAVGYVSGIGFVRFL